MLHFFWFGYAMREQSLEVYEFSNLEIAKWAEYYLGQHTAFNQAHCQGGRVTDNPKDILLGHLTWDGLPQEMTQVHGGLAHDWVRDNALITGGIAHPNTYILTPWVTDWPNIWTENMPFLESQLMAASKIFGLCGEIWIKRTHESSANTVQTRVKDKLVHCNMGLAAQNFQCVKKSFNPVGERQLLHISNLSTYKGFDVTCKSVIDLDTMLHVATQVLPNTKPGLAEFRIGDETYFFNLIGSVDNNDPEFQEWVVTNCDFYIHTAYADAQATTILESCARGLVPLVTPESGFVSPHAIYLTHDPKENHAIIQHALEMPEDELLNRSRAVREQVIRENNWKNIYDTVWNTIQADIEARKSKAN